jgi:hypothetical protein
VLCCFVQIPVLIVLIGLSFFRIPIAQLDQQYPLTTSDQYPGPLPTPIPPQLSGLWTGQSAAQPQLHVDYEVMTGAVGDTTGMSTAVLAARLSNKYASYGGFFQPSGARDLYNVTVYANMTATHGLPTFANIAFNALLRNVTGSSAAVVRATLHPLQFTQSEIASLNRVNGLTTALIVAIAMCFVPSSIAIFVVREREIKSKHIQTVSGVSLEAYWLANWAWDFVQCLIPSLICAFISTICNSCAAAVSV